MATARLIHRETPRADSPEQNAVSGTWSPKQIVLSLTVLMLISRGSLSTEERISRYWPECGKDTKVGQLLLRGQGVFGRYDDETVEHISELIRRVDGRNLKRIVSEELGLGFAADLCQQTDEREQEDSLRRLRPQVNVTSFAENGCITNGPLQDQNPIIYMDRFYPQSIPAHRLHPRVQDFSVMRQNPVGRALVTHRRWQKGDFMVRFDGITVPEVMLHTLQKTTGVHLWDPHFVGNLAHSCNPNVTVDMAENEMWAIQDIEPGAVLAMDYATTEDYLYRTFMCQCAALSCRGEVTGRKQKQSSGNCLGIKSESNGDA